MKQASECNGITLTGLTFKNKKTQLLSPLIEVTFKPFKIIKKKRDGAAIKSLGDRAASAPAIGAADRTQVEGVSNWSDLCRSW